MANILSLVWYKVLPAKFGGQKGIAGFSQHLGLHQNLVMLCAAGNEPTGSESYQVVNTLPDSKFQFIRAAVSKEIRQQLEQSGTTHLLLEHCYHGWHGVRLARKHKIKLIVHEHNIEFERFREMGKWWWPILFLLERWTIRSADLTMFKTREDLLLAKKKFGQSEARSMIVPYGIERTRIATVEEKKNCKAELQRRHGFGLETKILLFNGTLDYDPNALAVQHIVQRVIPELEKITAQPFVVLVTGRIEFPEYQHLRSITHPRYFYAGSVEDIDTYFTGADIFINPVSRGGGIKVKLVEALSFGLPVVTYRAGARGIDPEKTGSCMTMVDNDSAAEFAAQTIVHWEGDAILPQEFFNAYSWNSITEAVSNRIEQL